MRQVFIPDELEEQIESLRGSMSFDVWLALAITEKVFGTRLIPANLGLDQANGQTEVPEELWVAMVQQGSSEHFLLWRYSMPQGVGMCPVIETTEEGMEIWREQFALELNLMDGPPIAWRHFTGGEFVEWLRAPAPVQEGDDG